MSITINVTQATGGSFSATGVTTDSINLTVGGGIGPPGAGNVALAAGDGILITSTANVATINCTVEGVPESVLENLSNVLSGNATTGDVLAWNGTTWAADSNYATLTYVDNAVANLVDAAPGALDTLNELAAAIGDDANFSATITTSLAGKAAANHTHTFAEITNGTATVTGNLTLDPSTGGVIISGGTSAGSLTLNCEQNTHGVTIQSPAHSENATYTLTLPATAGSANQVLTTDGTGSLSWSNGTSGSGGGISWSSVPANSNANGTAGDVAYDSQGYFYLHDGTSWRRIQLATFGVVPTERLLTETGDSLLSETGDYIAHDGNPAQITITGHPQNATTSGATAAFSVTATVSDSSTITYQWQEFTGTIWADISAATSSTLTLGGLTSSDNGNQYRVTVGSDTATTVTSDVATLTVQATSNWTQVHSDIDGAAAGAQIEYAALDSNGTTMFVAAPQQTQLRMFVDNGTAWAEQNSSVFSLSLTSGLWPTGVSVSGDGSKVLTLASSATESGNATQFHAVLLADSGGWSSIGRLYGESSESLALSSNGLRGLISTNGGGYGPSGDERTLRLYDTASGFSELANVGNATDGLSRLGLSVAIDGDGSRIAATYSTGASNWNGSAYVWDGSPEREGVKTFDYASSSISAIGGNLTGTAGTDAFGYSLSFSDDGSRLAVGAPYGAGGGTQRGYARVYSWSGSAWVQLGSDVTGSADYDYAGWSVDLSADGSRLAVGLRGHDGNGSNSGTTRLYDWDGSAWVQVGGDIEGDAGSDYAGSRVSLSGDGDRVAIGAPGNDDGGSDAGQVRVFEAT